MIRCIRGGLVLAVAAVLAACGGGGGGGSDGGGNGGPTAATARFTASTYPGSGDAASGTLLGSADSLAATRRALFAAAPAAARAPRSPLAVQDLAIGRLLAHRGVSPGAREQAAAMRTEQVPCDSGHLTLTETYASANTTTPGDSVAVTPVSCVISGRAVTGTLGATVTAYGESSNSATASLAIVFHQLGTPQQRLDGTITAVARVTPNSGRVSFDFNGVAVVANGDSQRWFHHLDIDLTRATLSFSAFVEAGDGWVELDQLQPFVIDTSTGYPRSGVLQLSDKAGARLKLIAGNTRFRYAYFAAGNTSDTPDLQADGYVYGS